MDGRLSTGDSSLAFMDYTCSHFISVIIYVPWEKPGGLGHRPHLGGSVSVRSPAWHMEITACYFVSNRSCSGQTAKVKGGWVDSLEGKHSAGAAEMQHRCQKPENSYKVFFNVSAWQRLIATNSQKNYQIIKSLYLAENTSKATHKMLLILENTRWYVSYGFRIFTNE